MLIRSGSINPYLYEHIVLNLDCADADAAHCSLMPDAASSMVMQLDLWIREKKIVAFAIVEFITSRTPTAIILWAR